MSKSLSEIAKVKSRSPECEQPKGKKDKKKKAAKEAKQLKVYDEDDFGEGEIEDTQLVLNEVDPRPSLVSPKHISGTTCDVPEELVGFKSPYDPKQLASYPQRTRWEIPDSKIVFSSEFCSGNLAKATRGQNKNCFDLWVCSDSAPFLEGDYYRTWFYFSITGVPSGEVLTFTFKNLNN